MCVDVTKTLYIPNGEGRDSSVAIASRYGIESLPIPVAERTKRRVCRRSLAGVADLNSAGGMDVV